MRGIYENGLSRRSLYPAAFRPAAREDELIDFPFFDHAELQIAIEWRGCNRVPIRHGPPFYFQSLYAAERSISALRFVKTNVARKHPGRVPFGKRCRIGCILPVVRSAFIVVASAAFWSNAITSTAETPLRYRPIFQMDFI